jgi:trigger factor
MKVTVEKQPNCKASVRVEVPQEKIAQTRDTVTKSYVRQAKLPGFRPGKAPTAVVAKRFAGEIEARTLQDIADEAIRTASTNEKLNIITVDEAKNDDSNEGGATFTFSVTLRPEVALPTYKGLAIEVQKLEITDEFIAKILDRQREQFATMNEVSRPAQAGDFCVINYVGKIDGTPIKELLPESESFIAENAEFLLKIDANNFLPGFTEQLIGAAEGDVREVTVTVPDTANAAIAGKTAVYSVTVQKVKEQELPELNDAFAARLLPEKNLEELRAFVRERVEADAANSEANQKRANVLQALNGISEFDLPKSLVDQAAQRRINELVNTNLRQGVTQDILKENEEAIIGAASQQAAVDVKQEFLLLEIAKAEEIKVTNEDVQQQLMLIAQQNNMAPQKVMKELQKKNQMQNLATGILLEKTVKFLVDHAEITFKTVTPEQAEAEANEAR